MFSRVMQEPSGGAITWMFMAGIVGGVTIWTAHFIVMLGLHPGMIHGCDPFMIFASLGVAMAGVVAGLMIMHAGKRSILAEGGGAVLGLAVVIMH
jgi:NO-binding membrane sensor protein with MHYT domain